MSTVSAQSNVAAAPPTGGRRWVALIVGLIGMNASIVATTVYFATSDRSAGVEPNYYARALSFDSEIRQRATNLQLGWHAAADLRSDLGGTTASLTVNLKDAEGNAVSGARVRAIAFASLRSGERHSVELRETSEGYKAVIPVSAMGQWRVQVIATLGASKFTNEQDVIMQRPEDRTRAGAQP